MSKVQSVDDEERTRRAEARLAASRPAREAAAADHARDMALADGEGAVVRKSLAEIAANPYQMTEEERRCILSMTEEEIEAAALADPDNPPWTDEELAEARRERDERLAMGKRRE